jgi:hypothetical protein
MIFNYILYNIYLFISPLRCNSNKLNNIIELSVRFVIPLKLFNGLKVGLFLFIITISLEAIIIFTK